MKFLSKCWKFVVQGTLWTLSWSLSPSTVQNIMWNVWSTGIHFDRCHKHIICKDKKLAIRFCIQKIRQASFLHSKHQALAMAWTIPSFRGQPESPAGHVCTDWLHEFTPARHTGSQTVFVSFLPHWEAQPGQHSCEHSHNRSSEDVCHHQQICRLFPSPCINCCQMWRPLWSEKFFPS